MNYEYAIQIAWSTEDEAYIAMPAELPGCMADGKTPEEALGNVRQVIREWLEVAKEEGRNIPQPLSMQAFAQLQEQAQREFEGKIKQRVESAVDTALRQAVSALVKEAQHGRMGNTFQRFRFAEGIELCGQGSERD